MFLSCNKDNEVSSTNPENWSKRSIEITSTDSLVDGKTYLSVYSQIYSLTEHRTQKLTAMISMRNTSERDTIYLLRAEYFDTHGKSVRNYFDKPIFLAPMETTEIIIDHDDILGGTGSNFIFEWKTHEDSPQPLFEAIMTSTSSQQGISFVTNGVRIE